MTGKNDKWLTITFITLLLAAMGYQCSSSRKAPEEGQMQVIRTNVDGQGLNITLEFNKGESHNHPLMAIWLEDTSGNYLETLFVAESIGRGIFQHGDKSEGLWHAGPIRRPAALPYWSHQRGIKAPDGYYLPTPEEPMPDAVTGPTPHGSFTLHSKSTRAIPSGFVVFMEINQPWDWNDYWTNNKFPGDEQYQSSSQPSVVYAARIDLSSGQKEYQMHAIGHGHPSGKDGSLNSDLGTLSTALDIVSSARIILDR